MSAYPDEMAPPQELPPETEGGLAPEPGMKPLQPEVELREYTEVCLLDAIETCAKGVKAGVGAENADFAVKFGQAAASLAQAYQAVAGIEQQAANLEAKTALEEDKLDQQAVIEEAKLDQQDRTSQRMASRPQGPGTQPGQNK